MINDKFLYNKYSLKFKSEDTSKKYQSFIIARTILFSRVSWVITIILTSIFSLLDKSIFEEKSSLVFLPRFLIVTMATVFLIFSFNKKLNKYLKWSGFYFIISISLFNIFLMTLVDSTLFTPYFIGLFFSFTGIFITAGLGFRSHFMAFILVMLSFELIVGVFASISTKMFLVYNFFFLGLVFIFIFLSYYVEYISKENFIISGKLQDSLDEVKTLNELLPICAECKKIRDDDGYWQQIESYISKHSDTTFSHSICNDCALNLYDYSDDDEG